MQRFPSDTFVIIGVNCDDYTWIPQKLASTGKVTWRNFHLTKTSPDFTNSWGMTQLGMSAVIDREGVIKHLFMHRDLANGNVESAIEALVAAPE